MSGGVANFFKKKDRLDYNRFVTCPVAGSSGKKYVMEKGKDICPCCGQDTKIYTGHWVTEFSEG